MYDLQIITNTYHFCQLKAASTYGIAVFVGTCIYSDASPAHTKIQDTH